MQRICFTFLACLSILTLALVVGCSDNPKPQQESPTKSGEAGHSHSDALAWPKKDIEHEGFVISLGHHGNHFHGGDSLEPAVAISKGGKDVGDATMTCQLMDGETAIGEPVAMVFEPKTEDEPAHYAQGNITFQDTEKIYQVHFVVTLPGVDTPWKDAIDVECGHASP